MAVKGIRELAHYLDISIGTVSRALNGKKDVNGETRRRVLEAAERLGYVANQSGRALRKGSTGVIGFMMQTGHEITGQGDTFFMSVFDGVQTVFARHGLDLVALLCSSEEDPDAYLERVVARGFADGIMLSATRRIDKRFALLERRKIPFISLGRSLTDVGQPFIDLDFEGMAETVMTRLALRGHRRIAILRPHDDLNFANVFLQRCREVLAEHGLVLEDDLIFKASPNEAEGYRVGRELAALPDRPSAIVVLNDGSVAGVFQGLDAAGLTPGKDISVIGLHSPQARYLSPRLTCFDLSLRDLGIALAETLLASMPSYAALYPNAAHRKLWPMIFIDGDSG
ncbi:LacI family transcriptional regulator [Rhizobium sp. PP-F2F-G38]|uniref:LacI family DNA-binding transcriptional regulator n=1 Tax=Rhizobium sp. PP-CC-3G-465 TaxID=2135648 RepID=UPI000D86E39A|nr:LacI family transcriptional regulator [Rhizobium sp. PP-WC-1G-195]PYE39899.1 LacI family transcriptional regulator [Rhizobium sp. PP-F2F-G20b]PYE92265.1 LacI family transcriptional regulator [Rhizobium sp. PP-F2F-G38]TCL89206.1 LacI family transcriptional regulator [Rhizobium sp. PP-WC-2G-219]TCP82843.1 LacI family transcriptional regulator [Rhizobium sp. PP-CC-2G-626]TCQ01846.1 LacI family transcriptional regulator [Rhizobium sp. PP-F2F-G36]TCQ13980.1 LacI family transcriptional regulator